ncbi:hypothetical protein [Paenibacillus lutimineralis]|uniref:hypothetical protein n=1 Tax=Paenibacillus lutimineralis TaxID=2707005 RepID=UPI0013A61DAE|nr:hypothetical protein [Paenibacillus lutimineralis]
MTEDLWPIEELPICAPGSCCRIVDGISGIGLLFGVIGVVRLSHTKQQNFAGCGVIDRDGIDQHAHVTVWKHPPIVLRNNGVGRPAVPKIAADRVGDVEKYVGVVVVQILGRRAQNHRSAILALARQGGTARMGPPEIVGAVIGIDPFRIDAITRSGSRKRQSGHKANEH